MTSNRINKKKKKESGIDESREESGRADPHSFSIIRGFHFLVFFPFRKLINFLLIFFNSNFCGVLLLSFKVIGSNAFCRELMEQSGESALVAFPRNSTAQDRIYVLRLVLTSFFFL